MSEPDPPRLLIGIPAYRYEIDGRAVPFFANLISGCLEARIVPEYLVFHSPDVEYSHNVIMAEALRRGADLLWIHGADQFLAGMFPCSKGDDEIRFAIESAGWLLGREDPDERHKIALLGFPVVQSSVDALNYQVTRGQPVFLPCAERSLFRVARMGSGCTIYNLAWYRRAWPSGVPWFSNQIEVRTLDGKPFVERTGMDYWHCDRVADLGGQMFCSTYLQPYHARSGLLTRASEKGAHVFGKKACESLAEPTGEPKRNGNGEGVSEGQERPPGILDDRGQEIQAEAK